MKVFAQTTQLDPIRGEGLGPFGKTVLNETQALTKITTVISNIIGIMTIAASIWFMFQFLIGGMNWITSGGDKAKLHDARGRLTNAFIGLIIVIAGWAIIALTGQFFGYNILINPQDVINSLKIQ